METSTTAGNGNSSTPIIDKPDIEISVRQVFGLDSDMVVPAFS